MDFAGEDSDGIVLKEPRVSAEFGRFREEFERERGRRDQEEAKEAISTKKKITSEDQSKGKIAMGKPSPPFILYLVGVFALVNSAQSHSATWQSTGRESFSHILESFNVTSAWRAVLEDDALCRTPSARVTVNQSAKEAELTLWCPPDDYQPQPPTHSNSSHYALNLTGLQLSLCVIEFFTDKDFVVSLPSDVFAPAFSFTLARLELIDNQALAGSLDGVLSRIFRNYPNLQKLILTGNGFLGKVTDAMAEKLAHLEKFTLEP